MHKKQDWPKNWPIVKNLQFWSNLAHILSISPVHEVVLLTKFQDYWVKFADFSLLANFLASLVFYASVSILKLFKEIDRHQIGQEALKTWRWRLLKNLKTPFFSRYSKFLLIGNWYWSKTSPKFFSKKNSNNYGR